MLLNRLELAIEEEDAGLGVSWYLVITYMTAGEVAHNAGSGSLSPLRLNETQRNPEVI